MIQHRETYGDNRSPDKRRGTMSDKQEGLKVIKEHSPILAALKNRPRKLREREMRSWNRLEECPLSLSSSSTALVWVDVPLSYWFYLFLILTSHCCSSNPQPSQFIASAARTQSSCPFPTLSDFGYLPILIPINQAWGRSSYISACADHE